MPPKTKTTTKTKTKTTTMMISKLLATAAAVAVFTPLLIAAASSGGENEQQQQQQCERLPTSLTYSQDAAPADVSAILRVVVEKINRDVTGVVDVEVGWSGAELHKKVGERIVKCTVTRLAESVKTSSTAGGAGGDEDGDGDHAGAPTSARSTVDEHGRNVLTQCFEVPFTILDVNECTVPRTNSMAHRCHSPSVCVNTLGSYECLCPSESPDSVVNAIIADGTRNFVARSFWQELSNEIKERSAWEVSLGSSSDSSCPNLPSTHGCCDEDGHSKEGGKCRSSFRCPVDTCSKVDASCASNAICQRTSSPLSHPNYECICPPGYMGNGYPCRSNMKQRMREPKVKYDGKTPTEETRRALEGGLICGCHEPTVDACDGFPKCSGKHEMCTVAPQNKPHCTCQHGYVRDPEYGCVDEHPPLLNLRPDPIHGTDPKTGITHLSQGGRYEEYGVDVTDDNAEEYLRSLKITYSRPLPQGCLLDMGEFYVNYTVATPWTTPDFVRAKRTVVIDNVNECLIKEDNMGVGGACPELVAMCDVDAGATCKDLIGTYTCQCPAGTEGDGFIPIPRLTPDGQGGFGGSMIPRGYKGGTGCRDTSEPVIELLGPNPKRFRVARVGGVRGVMRMGENDESISRVDALIAEQRSAYESEIRSIIEATSGAELCATSTKPNVRPTDCVRAKDHTYEGVVDLTSRVSVGEPIPKDDGGIQWKVPYNVMDDAGNKAKTVWRDIIVEEVDIDDFERKAKSDVLSSRKDEVDRAVNEALAKERRRNKSSSRDCPPCDTCNCSDGQEPRRGMISVAECNSMCDDKIAAAASVGSTGETCTPTYLEGDSSSGSSHELVQKMLLFMEGLLGPSAMMLLLLGCTLATLLYIVRRMITALFFSTGPNIRTYYHTREDDERENVMLQNVSYYRSPTPPSNGSRQSPRSAAPSSAASSGPRPPPISSISSQRNGVFSPHESRANGTTPANQQRQPQGQGGQAYSSPFQSSDGTDNIYQSMSPITPLRNGTPSSSSAGSHGSAGQRSPYSLRNTN